MTEPVEILNPSGASQVVLLCEHASHHIPADYARLGLSDDAGLSHAAWDPGARALTLKLAEALDAPVVASTVSRLVYDCNRPPEAASAMPEKSELIEIPGNVGLTQDQRDARTRAVYDPFCNAVAQVLDARGPDTVVVTVHSFTPLYFGKPRQVELGLLHDTDSRLVDAMLKAARGMDHRRIARNQPYGPEDGVTHSLQIHALRRGLANVMLEVRNDLLCSEVQTSAMAQDILGLLRQGLKQINAEEGVS